MTARPVPVLALTSMSNVDLHIQAPCVRLVGPATATWRQRQTHTLHELPEKAMATFPIPLRYPALQNPLRKRCMADRRKQLRQSASWRDWRTASSVWNAAGGTVHPSGSAQRPDEQRTLHFWHTGREWWATPGVGASSPSSRPQLVIQMVRMYLQIE